MINRYIGFFIILTKEFKLSSWKQFLKYQLEQITCFLVFYNNFAKRIKIVLIHLFIC